MIEGCLQTVCCNRCGLALGIDGSLTVGPREFSYGLLQVALKPCSQLSCTPLPVFECGKMTGGVSFKCRGHGERLPCGLPLLYLIAPVLHLGPEPLGPSPGLRQAYDWILPNRKAAATTIDKDRQAPRRLAF